MISNGSHAIISAHRTYYITARANQKKGKWFYVSRLIFIANTFFFYFHRLTARFVCSLILCTEFAEHQDNSSQTLYSSLGLVRTMCSVWCALFLCQSPRQNNNEIANCPVRLLVYCIVFIFIIEDRLPANECQLFERFICFYFLNFTRTPLFDVSVMLGFVHFIDIRAIRALCCAVDEHAMNLQLWLTKHTNS